MRKELSCLALAAFALASAPVAAELCTIDAVPAATLLLPYFEVGLDGSSDVDTLFSINNASAVPTVAHVTLWGDWSLPTIDFDIFLTGYDVETVSLRNVFLNGNLPITAHAFNDTTDVISPHSGALTDNPQWDSDPDEPTNPRFMGCDPNLPLGPNPVLTGAFFDRIRCGHTGLGLACDSTNCVGGSHGDNIARGYITIDNVTDCNLLFPNSAGYFGAGGFASNVNQLWGDWFIVNGSDGFAQGDNLVHIEASNSGTFAAGDYTFYGRYVDGLATDQREPLATTWAARYLNGGSFDGGTDYLVWRDSKCQTAVQGFTCGDPVANPSVGPPWFGLGQTQIVAFDLAEQAAELCGSTSCLPLETQRVTVGAAPLDPPFEFGWMYLNLNHTLGDTSGHTPPCSTDGLYGPIGQSWVSTNMMGFASRLTVGVAAQQLTSACLPSGAAFVCDADGDSCTTDAECDDGATSLAAGDFCQRGASPIITFNP